MLKYPSLFEFPIVTQSQWVLLTELIFSSLQIDISALNFKSRHHVTLIMPRVALVSRTIAFR